MATKKNPTNYDLAKKVDDGFKAVGIRLDTVENKVQTFHDFMIVQKDRDSRPTSGAGLNITPDIIKLLTLLALAIVALVGGNAIVQ